MSTWEERMAEKAAARQRLNPDSSYQLLGGDLSDFPLERPVIPTTLEGELPPSEPDTARYWCTSCGLPDAPQPEDWWLGSPVPCPRCGSTWQWYGRLADRDGTATEPPSGQCLLCYVWRRHAAGQEHFGWAWWRVCEHSCQCDHHKDEVWMA